MTDTATPTPDESILAPRKKYTRPTKFPARLAVMLDQPMRDELDRLVEETGASLGEVTRALIHDGLVAADRRKETDV